MPLVNDFIEQSAVRTPHKTALIVGRQRYTYSQLDAMANRLANALQQRGVQRGDRVVLFLPNSLELVVGIFATLKAGGVFVVVNNSTKRDKLKYMVDNCRAVAIIMQGRQAQLAAALLGDALSLQLAILTGNPNSDYIDGATDILTYDEIQDDCPHTPLPRINETTDLACLIYTSGSTGEPKGVMSAHSNVVFAASSIISYLQNREDDIVINVLPLSFDYGLYQLLMTFSFGGTLVLERGFAYPAQILKKMEEERVTGFPGVPTLFAILLQMDLEPYDLSSLRYITNTAAALPPSHIQQIRDKFPGITLFSMYGLTETKRTLYLPPDQLDIRPGSVGIAIPGTEVWIEDEEGNRLGPNQVGELVIRGPHVMQGYWEKPEATAQRYRVNTDGDRVCYSGDLFRMDEEGFMYFVGRKDDIIKSRGEKVAPKEIENVLYSLPGVAEAAVIGVPDPVLGQSIKAIIVNHGPALTEREVLLYCRQNLEDFMVPQTIEFRDSLPKTSSGKIKKTGLS
jgi:long-chain acyl-CoA synthetase